MVSRAQLVLALALALAGCRSPALAEQPMAGELELCCKAAIDDVSFVGCRPTGYCRASESVWIRGPVTCTADTPEQCEGGRCCKLDVDPLASSTDTPAPVSADVVEPAPAPEPAPITPVPLDWQAKPTAVVVPKLVCPAAEQGATVLLNITVDASGRVTAATVRRGFAPECDALAIQALLQAEFEPARSPEGQAIASTSTWPYSFEAE